MATGDLIRSWNSAVGLLALLVLPVCGVVHAEDVARRWRIGGEIGGFSPQNEITSDSANILSLFSTDGQLELLFVDPRPDAARFGTLAVQPGSIARVSAQYAGETHFQNLIKRRRADVRLDLAWDLFGEGRFDEARSLITEAQSLALSWKAFKLKLRTMMRR